MDNLKLNYWNSGFYIDVESKYINELRETGQVAIPISQYVNKARKIIDNACKTYTNLLPNVFGTPNKFFQRKGNEYYYPNEESQYKKNYSVTMKKFVEILKGVTNIKDESVLVSKYLIGMCNDIDS